VFEDAGNPEEMRLDALTYLGRMSEDAREVDAKLEKHLKDPNRNIRSRVAITLALHGTDADVVGLLMETIEKGEADAPVREDAREALSILGPKAVAGVDQLVKWLKGPDANRRNLAINTLPRIGRDSPKALAALVALLKSAEDESVRQSAIYALANFGDRAV